MYSNIINCFFFVLCSRKPWIVTVEPTRIRVKILDREVIDCQLEHVTLGNRLQVGASMFIYNTPKSGHSSVTMHWY